MSKKYSIIFYLLILISFIISGCSGKEPANTSSSNGHLAINVRWETGAGGKTRVIPAATETINITITGPNINPSISETIQRSQVVNNSIAKTYELPAGAATATIQAKNSSSVLLAQTTVTATIRSGETYTTNATMSLYKPLYIGASVSTTTYVLIVDTDSLSVQKAIDTQSTFPMQILFTSAGYAYTKPSQNSNPYADIVNSSTESLTSSVTLPYAAGDNVEWMALRNYGQNSYIYYTHMNSREFYILDTSTNTLSTQSCDIFEPFGNITPRQITFSSDGTFAYVTTGPDVYKLNLTNNTYITQNMGFGPAYGIVITPNGNYIYVSRIAGDVVLVRNTSDLSAVTSIAVGSSPADMFITPDGNYVYVINSVSNNISVISTATNTVVATIGGFPVQPVEIAFDADSRYAYVTCFNSGTLYKINVSSSQVLTSVNLGYDWLEGIAVKP